MQTNSKFTVWSKPNCPGCQQAKQLIKSKGFDYTELLLGSNGITAEDLFKQVPSAKTVPQILVDDQLIGGLKELKDYLG